MTADFQNREAEEPRDLAEMPDMDAPLHLPSAYEAARRYDRLTDAEVPAESDEAFTRSYTFAAHRSARHLPAALAAYERVVAERDEALALEHETAQRFERVCAERDRARRVIESIDDAALADPEVAPTVELARRLNAAEVEIARLRSDLNQATAALPLLWALYEAYRDSGNVEPSREEMDAGYVELVSREDSLRVGSAFEAIFDRESEIRALIDAFRSSHFPAS